MPFSKFLFYGFQNYYLFISKIKRVNIPLQTAGYATNSGVKAGGNFGKKLLLTFWEFLKKLVTFGKLEG